MKSYDDDDLRHLYGKSYFEKRYEQKKQNWYVKAEFILKQFLPKKVLDIGCAEGFMVNELIKLGIDAYGIDGSEYALSKANSNLLDRLFRVNLNSDKYPFNDQTFDFIFSLHTIEHIHNIEHFTTELSRILKTKGKIWIITPDMRHDPENVHDVNMKKFFEWKQFFEKKGFVVKKKNQYGFLQLKGKLKSLKLYKLPEPLLTWIKFLIYWYLNQFVKKGGKETSFVLIKK